MPFDRARHGELPTVRFNRARHGEPVTARVEAITATDAVAPLAPVSLHAAPRHPRLTIRQQLIAAVERFAIPIALAAMIAVALGSYLALAGDDDQAPAIAAAPAAGEAPATTEVGEAPATTEVGEPAAPALAPAPSEPAPVEAPLWQPRVAQPTILPAGAPEPAAAHVAVRIESTPAGATATLIDNGVTTVLGTTPLDASLDPQKTYEVLLSMAGHETRVTRVDPAASAQVAVVFAPVAVAAEVEPTAPAPSRRDRARAAKRRARLAKATKQQVALAERARRTDRARREAREARARAPKVAAVVPPAAGDKAQGTGKLTVTSNLAALIFVDGRATGLSTPQQLALSAGAHKITLLDPKTRKAKTSSVEIVARQAARLERAF